MTAEVSTEIVREHPGPFAPGEGVEAGSINSDPMDRLMRTYGDAVYENYLEEQVSIMRVEETRAELRAARELLVSGGAANEMTAATGLLDDYDARRKEGTALRAQLDKTRDMAEREELQAKIALNAADRYDKGYITLSEMRAMLVTKNEAKEIVRKTVNLALAEARSDTVQQGPVTRVKKAVEGAFQQRYTDILLAGADSAIMERFGVASNNVATLIADLAFDPDVENLTDGQLDQMVQEYISAAIYPKHRVEFEIGLGGSEDAPSIRLPAMIDKALQQAKKFIDLRMGGNVSIRIFNAYELSASINGLDIEVAASNAKLSQQVLEQYIAEFYPECKGNVVFEYISLAELRNDQQAADRQWVEHNASSIPKIRKTLERLRSRGEEHKGADGTDEYVASHAQLFRSYITGDDSADTIDGPLTVIKFGGPGEANFDAIQAEIIKARVQRTGIFANTDQRGVRIPNTAGGNRGEVLSIIQKTGAIPAYYAGPGEVLFGAAHHMFSRWEEVLHHYETHGHDGLRALRALGERWGPDRITEFVRGLGNLATSTT